MRKTFVLDGLDCANCASKMENAIRKIDGISEASISFMTTRMMIEAPEHDIKRIIREAEAIIKRIDSDIEIQSV